MSQDRKDDKWEWWQQGYRWRVITTSAMNDSKIVAAAPCMMPDSIPSTFENAIASCASGERIYLEQWEGHPRFGSQDWERVAGWDSQKKKVYRIGVPPLEEAVESALDTVDPSPALS
jgi:hypothetical protein